MSVETITKEDLVQFKSELLSEISRLVKPSENMEPANGLKVQKSGSS